MRVLARLFSVIIWIMLFCSPSSAGETAIIGPDVAVQDNQIQVSTALTLNDKSLAELRNGVTKELHFTIDLFRVWRIWPDEFLTGKSFVRTLKSDPVTLQYEAASADGSTIVRKKFKSFESMIEWALNIRNLNLASVKELEKGSYFVRVTIESKIRTLPPVIGYFMIFLPENEFKIRKDSPYFRAGTRK